MLSCQQVVLDEINFITRVSDQVTFEARRKGGPPWFQALLPWQGRDPYADDACFGKDLHAPENEHLDSCEHEQLLESDGPLLNYVFEQWALQKEVSLSRSCIQIDELPSVLSSLASLLQSIDLSGSSKDCCLVGFIMFYIILIYFNYHWDCCLRFLRYPTSSSKLSLLAQAGISLEFLHAVGELERFIRGWDFVAWRLFFALFRWEESIRLWPSKCT